MFVIYTGARDNVEMCQQLFVKSLSKTMAYFQIDLKYILQEVIPSGSITNDTVIIMNGLSYFKKLVKHLDHKLKHDKR